METSIKEFQQEIAGILNSDEWFGQHDINWLPEDTLNVEYEIKKNLGQTGMVAVVTTPSLDYQGEHKTVISKKNYDKHVQKSVTFTLASIFDPSEVHEVVLNTDPTTKMVDGEKIYFSKWIDGNPIELTYGSPFPNLFGTMKDNVPNGFGPPNGNTRWFAFVDRAEYRTGNDPFFFATVWTIPDEQGRTMQVKKEKKQEKTVPWDELLEYVQFSGSVPAGTIFFGDQYIDTGLTVKDSTRIEIEYTPINLPTGQQYYMLGALESSKGAFISNSATNTVIQIGSQSKNFSVDRAFAVEIDLPNRTASVNGTTQTYTATPQPTTGTMLIGAARLNGNVVQQGLRARAGVRLKSCKIYDGNELVRDFKPARVDGVVCLFDNVTQEFFYNANVGGVDFIAGPVAQVAPTVEVTHYTVSGGCIPEGVEVEATPNGTRQEIVDHTRYTVTLPMSGEDPTSVSVAMETGGIVGMPFDKKLDWIGVKENAWFDTGYVPKVNDRVMLRFATPYAQRIVKEAALATTAALTGNTAFNYYSSTMNSANTVFRRGSANLNNTASFCKAGRFISSGNHQRQLRDGVMFSGPCNATETGTRAFGLGVFPVWNPTMPWENGTNTIQPQPFQQYVTSNINPTYSNTTISLALLGPNGGDHDIDNADLCHCFRGKFHYFGIWNQLDNDDTPQFFGYPVLKDGKICIYDRVSGEIIQNSYVDGSNPKADPISAIEYEEDEDFNTIETDSSEAVFTEQVETANKGFDVEVSLQVVENPPVNRGKPDSDKIATALDVAHRAIYTLAGYDTEHFNDFSPSTVRQTTVSSAGNKLLQVDARFRATPIL